MQKAVDLAKKISQDLEKNWLPEIEENGLLSIFQPVFNLNLSLINGNILSAFVIYAYHPDSPKLDIRKDRYENKSSILLAIGGDINSELFQDILSNSNEDFNNIVLKFLEALTDWRWQTIFSLLDYHSNMLRFANQKTESEKKMDKINKEGEVKELIQEYDIDTVAKVNKQKGELLELAIKSRERAERLLDEIKKDFVSTDTAVQADLGFVFTDTAKEKIDILSWRSYIKRTKNKTT